MPVSMVKNLQSSKPKFDVTSICHPGIARRSLEWQKWRLTFEGGELFIDRYLQKFSHREDESEYQQRKCLTYCPAFAKAALKKIINRTFSRAREITRIGGPKNYQESIEGVNGGVDLSGSTMNYFIGNKTLEELLKMSVVGIYVDMPVLQGPTLADKGNNHPYCYLFEAEQIRSYTPHPSRPNEVSAVLLTEKNFTYDNFVNLPCSEYDRYRYIYLKDTENGPRVFVRFYNENSEITNYYGQIFPEYEESNNPFDETPTNITDYNDIQIGEIDRIPFVLLDIGNSILADTSNYQISLLNMGSGDVWFGVKSCFPFYVEEFDPNSVSQYIREEDQVSTDILDRFQNTVTTTNGTEISVGPSKGRKYPKGTNQPAFINPGIEPLTGSMAKQEQMKKEIDQLTQLSVESLVGVTADEGVLSGINYINYILERAENQIASFWSMYEGTNDIAQVKYPQTPEITDPKDIQTEVTNLLLLIDKTPQLTLKKSLMKELVRLKLGSKETKVNLDKIYEEIDQSDVIIGDPLNIMNDVNTGLLSNKSAAVARGYNENEPELAAQDHAEKLARIQTAQMPSSSTSTNGTSTLINDAQARGLDHLSGNANAGSQEKQQVKDTTTMINQEDPTRGQGKNNNV